MAHKIQIKRGNKADLPTLDVGEFGLCQDTNELFIGNSGNQKIFPPTAPTTARFVVGTSTAGWTSADCDYLCDGTNDQEEIIQAINELPTSGGEVVILDGTYNIVSSILITRNNVSLKGTIGTILKSQGNFHMITLDSVENCSIEGLTLDGNNKATSTSSRLVCLANTKKCNVSKNQLQNWEAFGIYASGGSEDVGYTSITDNLISNVRTGISARRTNNLIANNRLYSGSSTGIDIGLAINTLCIANVIEDYNIGISIGNSSRGVTIAGNTIRNSETRGITLTATINSNVVGNTIIKGDGTPGDYTEAQYSIYLYGSTTGNLISSNSCMGKAPVVEGGTGNSAWGNKFDNTDDLPYGEGSGDMMKSVYDPTNKNQDVFAYMDTHKNNTSNPHQTTAAQVGAPSMTTSELTYYVNVATGSDSNDGLTEGTAFKTIQKALNSVPQIINHRVIINIAAGTYNEAILTPKITGHATLRLVGASKATTFIQTITSYVDCNVLILEALNIRTITSKSGRIQLTDCTFDYANDYGIVADDGTVVELLSVGISNKTSIAILSRYGAVVILVQVSGSGNTKALSAQYGGKISRGWGNTITGTTQEERLYGGIIVDESGIPSGVLPLTGGTISGNLAITGALTRNSKTVYDTGNITISTSAPGSALAEGAIHMVY